MSTSSRVFPPAPLPYEPLLSLDPELRDDSELAPCRGKRIGILIVAYNALTTLPTVLKRISPNVWNNVEEIAVFDDASRDFTYELALGFKMLRQLPKLEVLQNSRNLGYGGNQKAGYRYFIEKGFDIVVLLHGDGQYAPEILSHLYSPIVSGEADAVFGSRMMSTYGGPLKGGMPLYKYAGNRILTALENMALGMKLTEFHSGYRAYNLHALSKIDFTHMTNDFHFDTEIIIKLHHQRFHIAEVPVPTYYGEEICYVNGMRYAKDILRAVHRYTQTCRSATCYPEFQEYYVKYPVKRGPRSSHAVVQRLVGKSDHVLELGSGNGHFAAELKKETARQITGVSPVEQPERRDVFENFVCANLDDVDLIRRTLSGQRFDTVLLMDVLEHTNQPQHLLEACHEWIGAGGAVIVSVPNIAHIYVRLMLLFGRFNYSSRGILDRTHLRFFTRKTARQLAKDCGFRIIRERATSVPLEIAWGLSPRNPLVRVFDFFYGGLTRLWPALFGYQFVMLLASNRRET